MAVNAMTSNKRRFLYGLNVAVAVILAIVLAGIVIWAAGRFGGRVDLTRGGVNSLTPRTIQLLKGLPEHVVITGLYSTALKEVRPYAEKHQSGVSDLLDLYETAGRGKVTTHMIDATQNPEKITDLLARLKEKPVYRDEAQPHAEALAAFPTLSATIAELLQNELTQLEQLRGADPSLQKVQPIGIIERNLQLTIRQAQAVEAEMKAFQEEEIPRYGRAVEVARDYLKQVRTVAQDAFDWMSDAGAKLPEAAPGTLAFFSSATARYTNVLSQVQTQLEQMNDLGAVKLEDLFETLKRGQTVLVETETKAEVLTQEDVWPYRTNRNAPPPPDGDMRDFAGEQAVSSALLALTQKTRTAIVFTRFGGQSLLTSPPPQNPMMMQQQPPQAPYQGLNDLLQKDNFITLEWDVQAQPTPPKPEDAERIVYVVFPPAQPPQPDPRRPAQTPEISPKEKQLIYDAVKDSAMAIFLAPWAPPASPYIPTPGKYEFNDYLKETWGVAVEDGYLGLQFVANPQREDLMFPAGRNLVIDSSVFHFSEHPIGSPLKGLPASFQTVAPLRLLEGDELPENVTVEPVAVVDDTEDVWGVSNISRISQDLQKNQGTKRYPDDLPAPFTLCAAASDGEGRKAVVFASDTFISDATANASQLVMAGGGLRMAKLYPGNADLFINALHWLTGNADRIAVGAQRSDVPRLDKLEEGAPLTLTRVFLVGIWPACALLAGAVVWIVRRR